MTEHRLPAHLEAAGLIRAVETAGGFATVLSRGDRDSGVVLILTMDRGANLRLWERVPRLDGPRVFEVVRTQDPENEQEFDRYLGRRTQSDRDIWLIELDVANPERFIDQLAR